MLFFGGFALLVLNHYVKWGKIYLKIHQGRRMMKYEWKNHLENPRKSKEWKNRRKKLFANLLSLSVWCRKINNLIILISEIFLLHNRICIWNVTYFHLSAMNLFVLFEKSNKMSKTHSYTHTHKIHNIILNKLSIAKKKQQQQTTKRVVLLLYF